MAYYMLYTSVDGGPFSPQFGDKSRQCVAYELSDMKDTAWRERVKLVGKIIAFDRVPTQAQVDAKALELNR
jgi:hypothetical protein